MKKNNSKKNMVGTILLILTSNFDDMAFLSCQVILEENSFDVITASKENGTFKGGETSLMAVSLKEATSQNIEYQGLVLIGGEGFNDWGELKILVKKFQDHGKKIGSVTNTRELLELKTDIDFSEPITKYGEILFLNNLDHAEEFAEKLVSLLNS